MENLVIMSPVIGLALLGLFLALLAQQRRPGGSGCSVRAEMLVIMIAVAALGLFVISTVIGNDNFALEPANDWRDWIVPILDAIGD